MNDEKKVNAASELAEQDLDIKQRLNMQTARIAWSELERFFASAKAVYVDASLDLIDVAAKMHDDNSVAIRSWMSEGLVALVRDDQALDWTAKQAELWAVVVSPWVLVQQKNI